MEELPDTADCKNNWRNWNQKIEADESANKEKHKKTRNYRIRPDKGRRSLREVELHGIESHFVRMERQRTGNIVQNHKNRQS